MKVCGIIAEYNPFHNGHRYHIEMARKQTDADVMVAVMSGNFLQRGEPAIIDKWKRAKSALHNGVDLVIELPTEWSVQSADYFAKGAVRILQQLSCDYLCFGTEVNNSFDYNYFGQFFSEYHQQIISAIEQDTDQTLSYPQKMTKVLHELYKFDPVFSPNHILGLSYAKENASYKHPMKLVPIKRKNAGYHEENINNTIIASATAIRKAVKEEKSIDSVVPLETKDSLASCLYQTWDNYWPFLQYRLLVETIESLKKIYQMTEGLEVRMKKAALKAKDLNEFVGLVKSKRYTWTRIQRLCCYVLLNVGEHEMRWQQQQNYFHILGFTKIGRKFLKERELKNIYVRIGKREAKIARLLVKSDQIYQLAPAVKEQNLGRIPYICKEQLIG